MPVKASYVRSLNAFQLSEGVYDTTTALTNPVKMRLVQSSGNLIANELHEKDDILSGDGSTYYGHTGSFGGYWSTYQQTNMLVNTRKFAAKNNLYAAHIYRPPNISNSVNGYTTWGGVTMYPNATTMRRVGRTYRFSFDYRGYSGGYSMEVYQNYEVGWGDMGIGLPTPWYTTVSAFDTDWEWRRFEYEFTVTDNYVNFVPGSNLPTWNSTTQYGSGWYGLVYNGYVYRHNGGAAAPSVGVNPETYYTNGSGIFDWKVPQTAGYLNLYRHMKIGFNYEDQNSRGTHVFVDNIQMTDITDNKTFRYNLTNSAFEASDVIEKTNRIVAKGTAYVAIDKGDGGDRFAVEGNQTLTVNGTQIYSGGSRGLRLTVLTESTMAVVSDTYYDIHGDDNARTNLANALAGVTSSQIWVLTSYDAIGTSYTNTTLVNQMKAMGSKLWDSAESATYLWSNNSQVRNPYAAVGRGQVLIKEDGSNGGDTQFKHKGVVDVRL